MHELLQKEFGIEDGLASTITWGEMLKKHPGIKLPKVRVPKTGKAEGEEVDLDPNEPFVMILDIATGTATFLVEVIEVIFQQLKATWDKGGTSKMPAIPGTSARFRTFTDYWNAYVPNALLPRLYGYELMMAPYTIAHMKLALKFSEINARLGQSDTLFKFESRAHIYLTNTLEPPSGFQTQQFADFFPALAHEAKAVNDMKRSKRFTLVIGNPPYAGVSANLAPAIRQIIDPYRFVDGERIQEKGALQFEKNLNDDYVKFLRFAEIQLQTHVGILGMITNNGFEQTATLRGMRHHLLQSFDKRSVIDLHGDADKRELDDEGKPDKNVFDIKRGVAISLLVRHACRDTLSLTINRFDLKGLREESTSGLPRTLFHRHLFSRLKRGLIDTISFLQMRQFGPIIRGVFRFGTCSALILQGLNRGVTKF